MTYDNQALKSLRVEVHGTIKALCPTARPGEVADATTAIAFNLEKIASENKRLRAALELIRAHVDYRDVYDLRLTDLKRMLALARITVEDSLGK